MKKSEVINILLKFTPRAKQLLKLMEKYGWIAPRYFTKQPGESLCKINYGWEPEEFPKAKKTFKIKVKINKIIKGKPLKE